MTLHNQGVDGDGLLAAANALSQPAGDYGNDSRVEALWAMKAMEHAEVYFNILCSVDPKQIPRLSPCDDEVYEKFRESFPDFNVAQVEETNLKSDKAKKEWRDFCELFKHVDDFSFATLLRLDSAGEYSEDNSIIVTKIQFYAIEIARNREGHNDQVRQKFKPTPRKKRMPPTAAAGGDFIGGPNMSQVEQELKQIISGNHRLLQ